MKRPDGNIVVLTFDALLSCFVICVNCKDLLTNSSSRFKYRFKRRAFFAAHNLQTYRIMFVPSFRCSDTYISHRLRL